MADESGSKKESASEGVSADAPAQSSAAVKNKPSRKKSPKRKPPAHLPPWKVLLHNDDKNDMPFVVKTIVQLTPLNENDAVERMKEAHETGVALLLTTHKERAELYLEQFQSKGLCVTIEAAE
jgi:ATP-dependent Clp protease adaptor protein ClpS